MISKSPSRHTFRRDKYIEQQTEKGLMDDSETADQLQWYDLIRVSKEQREQDPAWQKDNLEYDLRTTDWILEKTRASEEYAQNLYAAMCNTDFTKNDVWPILQNDTWSCSWRYAGGIIADMRQEGDYIDWYCSGMGGVAGEHEDKLKFVGEGVVTDEIRADLLKLGWLVREDKYI